MSRGFTLAEVLVALVLLVFTVVQLIESYVLTPRVMGDRTGLHPMVIIVAILANLFQVGALVAFESIKPDLKKINPAQVPLIDALAAAVAKRGL